MMPARAGSYDALRAGFAWDLPARLNMAVQACDARAASTPDRLAVIDLSSGTRVGWNHRDLGGGHARPLRTEIVKAYVVARPGAAPDPDGLKTLVKDRLAIYSCPWEITFLDALPMTVTGKVIRRDLKARAAAETKETT